MMRGALSLSVREVLRVLAYPSDDCVKASGGSILREIREGGEVPCGSVVVV